MLKSARLLLRPIQESDINSTYLNWLNDPVVNRFLETRFTEQTLTTLHDYWKLHHDLSDSPWFAICLHRNTRHIGNIKLGPINPHHQRADISLFIGERDCWGQGFAHEAISLIRDWAFKELKLEKLNAGMYSKNVGSKQAFEKCGFELEGTLRNEVLFEGERADVFRLGLSRATWEKSLNMK